jgi:hypothetical protein
MPKDSLSEHARALSASGASKGGLARKAKLSAEERKEIASNAAKARWNSDVPKALFEGELQFGDMEIPCAVLEDGTRLISERGFAKGLETKRGGAHWIRRKETGAKLPVFASANNLKPFITQELETALTCPILYKTKAGNFIANGMPAELITEVCKVWVLARNAKALHKSQRHIADRAEVIIFALAKTGITALVDEATGYQEFRDRNALQKILEMYIAKEMLPWTRRFSPEFYKEMFRLRKWQNPESIRKPRLVGLLTDHIVYKKLPSGVLEQLKRTNPKNEKGRRKHKHHQFLTEDVGNPHLDRHLAVVTALMRASKTWKGFRKMLDVAVPTPGDQRLLGSMEDMYEESDEEDGE